MKLGTASHAVLAEARRHVWAVRSEFWDSFARVLMLDTLPISGLGAEIEVARPEVRRQTSRKEARTGVAVVPLQGVITPKASILSMLFGGGGGLGQFRASLREALLDDDVDAIVLDVDSPGGSVALVEETAADIRTAREIKPVVAVANVDAGSAAYWLASQASELVVTPSGMVGSIGAFILHYDFSGMNEKMGVDPTFIKAGRFKTEGNPEEPLTDEATAHLQTTVDDAYDAFVRDVAAGRGIPEKTVRRGYGEGRMLTASRALDAGMVDAVEPIEAVVSRYLDGAEPPSRSRAEIPSDPRRTLSEDEAFIDETFTGKSPAQVARSQDQALADEAIAALAQ